MTTVATPAARCLFCPRPRVTRGCCRACHSRHRCSVCSAFKVKAGPGWCSACRDAYQLASRILMSFPAVRPADPAVLKANIKKYRRRAAKCLPLFTGP